MKKKFSFENKEANLIRLDYFLSKKLRELNISRAQIQRNIKQKNVKVNQKVIQKGSFLLKENDYVCGELELRINLDLTQIRAQKIDFEIIYEDKFLAVIDKPAGLTVHPSESQRENTLVNALLEHFKIENLSDFHQDQFRPGIVHRLDKDTSGLLVIAKDPQTHAALAKQLRERTLSRIYWSIISQVAKEDSGVIESQICRHPKERKKMLAFFLESNFLESNTSNTSNTRKSRYAKTHWWKLEDLGKFSLLKIKLETGRTHQIRAHFKLINRPLLGDILYGKKSGLISRQCLHAKQISFVHPVYQRELTKESALPEDFRQVILKFNPKSKFLAPNNS